MYPGPDVNLHLVSCLQLCLKLLPSLLRHSSTSERSKVMCIFELQQWVIEDRGMFCLVHFNKGCSLVSVQNTFKQAKHSNQSSVKADEGAFPTYASGLDKKQWIATSHGCSKLVSEPTWIQSELTFCVWPLTSWKERTSISTVLFLVLGYENGTRSTVLNGLLKRSKVRVRFCWICVLALKC